jgi:hypothetical protein
MGISVDKPKEPMVVLMVTPAMENYIPRDNTGNILRDSREGQRQ